MPKKVTLHEEKILESWSVLIEKAQGRAKEIVENTTRFIKSTKKDKFEHLVNSVDSLVFPLVESLMNRLS